MVSETSIFLIIFSMVFSLILPVTMAVIIRKNFKTPLKPFLAGCVAWFVSAAVLEQALHSFVLSTSVGVTIQNNIWLYGIYAGLAAGVFEETGRFVVMKLMLKDSYSNRYNAIMFGAGHGGIEAFFVLGSGMLNNLIYAVSINTGSMGLMTENLTDEQKAAFEQVTDSLINTKPYEFLLGDFERISAVILHIALSLLVWCAVVYGKKVLFPAAIFLHLFVDAATVIINGYGVNTFVLEAMIFVMSVAALGFALRLWKNAADAYDAVV